MSMPSRSRRSFGVSTLSPPTTSPRADDIGRRGKSGRHVGAGKMHRRSRLCGNESIGLEVDAKALRVERIHEGCAGEIAGNGAVARRDFTEIFRAHDPTGAFHVLDDKRRTALDMAGQV